jgi:GNAT superfamily N-acetyltransferase
MGKRKDRMWRRDDRGPRVTVGPATAEALAGHARWSEMAGVSGQRDEAGAALAVAAGEDALGRALTSPSPAFRAEFLSMLLQHDPLAAQLAATAALAAYAEGKAVGIAIAGPSTKILPKLLQERGFELALKYLVNAVKIDLLAVDPDFRGSGAGSRLLTETIAIHTAAGGHVMHGQFNTGRHEILGPFYRGHGFEVLAPGASLDLSPFLGLDSPIMAKPDEGETMMYRRLR